MKILHLIKNISIVFLSLAVAFVLLGYIKGKHAPDPIDGEGVVSTEPEHTQEDKAFSLISLKGVEIFIDHPVQNTQVTSPLTITGRAPGNWFFEASAPVTITNWDGLIIGESYIQAQGDWMTTEYVPFRGTIEFTNTEYGDHGFLILQKDNPSGEPQFDDSVEWQVMFQ